MVYMMCAMVLVVTGPAEFQRESTHWKATLHCIHALHVQNKLDCGGRPEKGEGRAEEEGGAEEEGAVNVYEMLKGMELSSQFEVFGIVPTYSLILNICYGLFLGILPFVFLKLSGVST